MSGAAQSDVIILGAGISGLAAAWHLARAGKQVTVLEKSGGPGGVIWTSREGDWLYERGPHTLAFKLNDETHGLIRELGLEGSLQHHVMRESDRYIWRGGRLRRVPVSPGQLLGGSALSRRTAVRALPGLLRRHQAPQTDVSIGACLSPVLGRAAITELLAPAMAGIYAADPFSLSLEAIMPKLHKALSQTRTPLQALRQLRQKPVAGETAQTRHGAKVLASFTGGMEMLPRALAEAAERSGARMQYNADVTRVSQGEDGGWTVTLADGGALAAKDVILTVPAGVAAGLLSETAPETARELKAIRYSPMVIVHIGVPEDEVGINSGGFGYLAVREPGIRALGMIWNERLYPNRAPAGHRLFTVFFGGSIDPSAVSLTDEQLVEAALNDMKQVMKWRGDAPAFTAVTRHGGALPWMEVGHPARIRAALAALPHGLHLAGNYVAAVSIPGCLNTAKNLAKEIAR